MSTVEWLRASVFAKATPDKMAGQAGCTGSAKATSEAVKQK